jgi:hypothetical protein
MRFLEVEQIRRMEIDAIKLFIRRRIGGYHVAIKDLTTDNLLYRGVPWAERPMKIAQLWHPPAGISGMGRANRPGASMFYCSRGAPPVFYEMRAKVGDRIALSEWAVAQPFLFHFLGFDNELMQAIGAPLRSQLQSLIPNETNRNIRIRRALSMPFTESVPPGEEYRYKQTIAIHELLFDGASRPVAGMAYPSMGMRGVADNLVVWPAFVPKILRPKSVRYVLIESVDPQSFAYSFVTLGLAKSFSDEDIAWMADVPNDARTRSRIALEGHSWVLRDGSGRVYDIH